MLSSLSTTSIYAWPVNPSYMKGFSFDGHLKKLNS